MPFSTQLLLVTLLVLLSLADLKYRVVPAVEIFFFGSILTALIYQSQNLLSLAAVVFSVAYGILLPPAGFALPLLFWPSTWPALFVSYGVRKELLGRGDLFAMGGITALYSPDVTLLALLGTIIWTRWWSNKYRKSSGAVVIPLMPGMVIGTILGIALHLFLKAHLPV